MPRLSVIPGSDRGEFVAGGFDGRAHQTAWQRALLALRIALGSAGQRPSGHPNDGGRARGGTWVLASQSSRKVHEDPSHDVSTLLPDMRDRTASLGPRRARRGLFLPLLQHEDDAGRRLHHPPEREHRMSASPAPERRVCAYGACSTVLSIYGRSAYCWIHEAPSFGGGPLHLRAAKRPKSAYHSSGIDPSVRR